MIVFPPEIAPLPHLAAPASPRAAVFFDRDDTLIANASLPPTAFANGVGGDLADPAHVVPLPGAADACARARDAGYAVVVVTNQGVAARGGASLAAVAATCARMVELLDAQAGRSVVDAVFACPFHPHAAGPPELCREHPWRKPAPGMLLAAADLLALDLGASWMVGDAERDCLAARAAGLCPRRCVLLGGAVPPFASAPDISRALDLVLAAGANAGA